jgi:enoyl-CoA hydratase
MPGDMHTPVIHTPAQLLALAANPYVALPSPFDAQPVLLVSLGERLSPGDVAALEGWIMRLPCVLIGVGEAAADESLPAACDVRVADTTAATRLIERIRRAPRAASVLAHTLRITSSPGLSLEAALHVESLAYATLQGGAEFRHWLNAHPPTAQSMQFDEPAVLLERQGDVLALRLNRPARRNALSVELRDALIEALQLVVADERIARVRLDGAGDCFSIGGDLAEFGTAPDPASAHLIRNLQLPAAWLARCAERIECHVHGACIGAGCELPAFARRVVAAPGSWFQLPELDFGLIPGAGGCVSLPRRIGRQRTAWLALSGRRIPATTALAWGLIDAIEPRDISDTCPKNKY